MSFPRLITRRTFLSAAGTGFTTLYLASCVSAPWKRRLLASDDGFMNTHGPIDRTLPEPAPFAFTGDSPERPHRYLLTPQEAERGLGLSPEVASVVVVGGGMSGLISAYTLRDLNPIVLEQATRFGGNARGESWRGMDYSIGAAYFSAPDPTSKLLSLYRELGIPELIREKSSDDPVALGGHIRHGFWNEYPPLSHYLKRINLGQDDEFPDIPPLSESQRKRLDELDRLSLKEHLVQKVGKLPPALSTLVDYYCWSSMNAASCEVSAASGLNFLLGETNPIWVAPGGNAALAGRILERLCRHLPNGNLRPQSLVFRVKALGPIVEIVYLNAQDEVRKIHAKAVVLSCPKFVVGRLLDGIESERKTAISKLKYRGYLVANLLLEKVAPIDFYDLFVLGDRPTQFPVTDVIYGNFVSAKPHGTILTLYRPMARDGYRDELLDPNAYQRLRSEFEREIETNLMPLKPFRAAKQVELRIARWGHPIPVSSQGVFSQKVVDKIRKPFVQRVFFVEQDNWMTPALETGAIEALTWETAIRKTIRT